MIFREQLNVAKQVFGDKGTTSAILDNAMTRLEILISACCFGAIVRFVVVMTQVWYLSD